MSFIQRPTTAGSTATVTETTGLDDFPPHAITVEQKNQEVDDPALEKAAVAAGPNLHDCPDGGREAWQVVAGAWFVSFCTWGYVNAFGVFQTTYQSDQLKSYTPSDISWIGSVQLAMIFWGGLPCGRLFDMGYMRSIMIVGSLWTVFCLMMVSLAKTYWQILLAQGFGLGIGLGMLYIPALSCIPHWFHKRRALANGVLASGSSLGGIIFPIMLNNLTNNPRVGFAWAVRATGFLVLGMLVLANILLKTRLPPNKERGPLVDFRVFKDVNYSIFVAGSWFILLGIYLPFFYLEEYALLKGVQPSLAFYTLAILNAASVFGRTIPNYLADIFGVLNILAAACFITGILIFIFLVLSTSASFIVFSIIFGFFSGTYVSAIGAGIATLTKDMRTIGLRLSMFFALQGFAALVGTPIAGAIITSQGGSFVGAACFSGVAVILGSTIMFIARTRHGKAKGLQRV